MPSLATHYCFALSVKDEVSDFYPFALGAQGPDPFFFRPFCLNPFIAKRFKMIKYGSYLHRIDSAPLWMKMISLSAEDDELYSYVVGLLAHYAMDRTFHPFVYYRTGFDSEGHLREGHAFDHLYFEALLDSHAMKQAGVKIDTHRVLDCPRPILKKISALYVSADPEHTAKNCFLHAARTYRLAMRLLKSKRGIKRKMWKIFGKRSMLFAFSTPPDTKEADLRDVENAVHREWKNPDTGAVHNESVGDLYRFSILDFKKGKEVFDRLRRGEDAYGDLVAYIGGLDHSGVRFGEKNKYSDPF
ncbi:MAG: hypothetical protein K6F32_07660 [Bacilli bacterium]|nr:hypothetical protein [Bacilli bacterium]